MTQQSQSSFCGYKLDLQELFCFASTFGMSVGLIFIPAIAVLHGLDPYHYLPSLNVGKDFSLDETVISHYAYLCTLEAVSLVSVWIILDHAGGQVLLSPSP